MQPGFCLTLLQIKDLIDDISSCLHLEHYLRCHEGLPAHHDHVAVGQPHAGLGEGRVLVGGGVVGGHGAVLLLCMVKF